MFIGQWNPLLQRDVKWTYKVNFSMNAYKLQFFHKNIFKCGIENLVFQIKTDFEHTPNI